jgi:hypothetical protein
LLGMIESISTYNTIVIHVFGPHDANANRPCVLDIRQPER